MELDAVLRSEVAKLWTALDAAPVRRGWLARLGTLLRGLVI